MRYVGKLALASVSLFAIATPAFAQDAAEAPAEAPAADEAAYGSGDIVVQARRRDESVQDVPAVVNAVTPEAIEKLNLRKLEDITAVVPGLNMTTNANGVGSSTTIRGIQYDVNASGDAGTVQYYYNDAPVSSGIVMQGLYDVGQIEVLRGPQGTLKGRASPSGSISVTFRQPDLNEAGGYMQGTVTSIDGYNLNGAINVPLVEGKLGIRVAGILSDDEGNRVRPVSGNGVDPFVRTEGARFSVRADPFDGVFLVDFSYSTLNRESAQYDQVQSVNQYKLTADTPASPVTIGARDRLAINSLPARVDQSMKDYNLVAQLKLFGQRLTYVGNWFDQRINAIEPGDDAGLFANTTAPQLGFTGGNPAVAPVQPLRTIPFAQPTNTRSKGHSHEIRVQNEERVAGMFDYVVGYLNYKNDSPTSFEQVLAGVGNPATGVLSGVILQPLQRFSVNEENSVFGNVTMHIGENSELSGGVRHIWFKTQSGVLVCGQNFAGCAESPAMHVDDKDQATIFTVSAKHNFTRDLMVYASYGTSWRPQTIYIGGPTSPTPEQAQFLGSKAEKSKNIEVGVKSSWLDGRLRLNLTGFYQDFNNYPYRVPGVSGTGVFSNDIANNRVRAYNYIAGVPVEVLGVEGDFSFDVTERWNISGNAAYSDGKIKNGTVPCNDLNGDGVPDALLSPPSATDVLNAYGAAGVGVCNVNMRANVAPPFSANLQTEYRHPLNDRLEGFGRGLFTYKGNSIGDPTNAWDKVDAYGILNLYAGVRDRDGGWEITAYAKNVTNTFRVLERSQTRNFTPILGSAGIVNVDATNYYGITVTNPREFGISARFSFGSR